MKRFSVMIKTEDNLFYKLLSEYLGKQDVKEVRMLNGGDVLKEILAYQPDAIVFDDETKEVESEFICKKVKRKFPHIPILLMTRSKDMAHVVPFLKIPVEDFVIKPVKPAALYLRIKKIVEGLDMEDNGTIKNGNLKINSKKKKAEVDKNEIKLTPLEYKILLFLTSNQGKVLSRKAILNHVWGYDGVIDRNVDVHVSSLRRKLQDKGVKESCIKTVPSFGYMIEECERGE